MVNWSWIMNKIFLISGIKKVTLATLLPKNSATTWWASRTTGSQETMMVIPYDNLLSEISFFIASDQFVLLCFNFNQSIFASMFRLGSKTNAGPEESLSLSPSWSTKSWGFKFRKGDSSFKKTWMMGSVSRGPKSKRWRRSHTPVSNLWKEVSDRYHCLISTCSVSSLIVWQQGLIVCPYLPPSPRKAKHEMSIAILKATWSVLKKVSRGGRTSVSVLFLMKSLAQLAITTKHLDIKIRWQDIVLIQKHLNASSTMNMFVLLKRSRSGCHAWVELMFDLIVTSRRTTEECDIPDALGEVAGSGVDQAVDLRNQILGPI